MINEKFDSNRVKFGLLQVFRGCAAILVVLHHSTGIVNGDYSTQFMGNAFQWGSAGVDFFFVLSGFLIFYLHGDDIGKPARIQDYLRKRLLRIYPIYWIVTLIILPVYFLVPQYGQGHETTPSGIIGSLLLLPMSRTPILVAGWSLRHEMLFYLIFALLIYARSWWMVAITVVWVTSLFGVSVACFENPLNLENPCLQVLLWPQNLEFVFGCAVAYVARTRPNSRSRCVSLILLPLFLFAFWFVHCYAGSLDMRAGKRAFLYGVTASLIVYPAVLIDKSGGLGTTIQRSIVYRLMTFLGDASYSIYLIHGPGLSVLFKLILYFRVSSVVGVAPAAWFVIVATVIAGCLCHIVVERPLMAALRRPRMLPVTCAT